MKKEIFLEKKKEKMKKGRIWKYTVVSVCNS